MGRGEDARLDVAMIEEELAARLLGTRHHLLRIALDVARIGKTPADEAAIFHECHTRIIDDEAIPCSSLPLRGGPKVGIEGIGIEFLDEDGQEGTALRSIGIGGEDDAHFDIAIETVGIEAEGIERVQTHRIFAALTIGTRHCHFDTRGTIAFDEGFGGEGLGAEGGDGSGDAAA